MQVINSHISHLRALDTGKSVTVVIASQHIHTEVCEQPSSKWIKLISIYSQAPRFVHDICGIKKFVIHGMSTYFAAYFIACVLFFLCVCVYLFYIYLAYVQHFMFSSGFNVIVMKCMVSSITYFSYCHHHYHHVSHVLVWLPFCKLENHSEVDR